MTINWRRVFWQVISNELYKNQKKLQETFICKKVLTLYSTIYGKDRVKVQRKSKLTKKKKKKRREKQLGKFPIIHVAVLSVQWTSPDRPFLNLREQMHNLVSTFFKTKQQKWQKQNNCNNQTKQLQTKPLIWHCKDQCNR